MIHLSDAAVDAALAGVDLCATLRAAFVDFARGRAAMQPRVRTDCAGVRLSTLGAVWPAREVAGAKIYTTIEGRFSFVIVLFSTTTGEVLATLDANAITASRTAAVSSLAAGVFARPDATTLALFGTGVQARAHVAAFAARFALRDVRVVARGDASQFVRDMRETAQCAVCQVDAREALRDAHLVVTATRAKTPLFEGAWVAPGAFVAAVGSSKPDARELDDALLTRAAAIAVEWRDQALVEAGDLVLCGPDTMARARVIELGEALAAPDAYRRAPGDIVVFKSVGVGLADVATAELAYRETHAARAAAA